MVRSWSTSCLGVLYTNLRSRPQHSGHPKAHYEHATCRGDQKEGQDFVLVNIDKIQVRREEGRQHY